MTGKNHYLECSKEIKLYKQLRNLLNKSKMIFFKQSLKSLVLEMKLKKNKRNLKIYQINLIE